jgi:hypothetical protein
MVALPGTVDGVNEILQRSPGLRVTDPLESGFSVVTSNGKPTNKSAMDLLLVSTIPGSA